MSNMSNQMTFKKKWFFTKICTIKYQSYENLAFQMELFHVQCQYSRRNANISYTLGNHWLPIPVNNIGGKCYVRNISCQMIFKKNWFYVKIYTIKYQNYESLRLEV